MLREYKGGSDKEMLRRRSITNKESTPANVIVSSPTIALSENRQHDIRKRLEAAQRD